MDKNDILEFAEMIKGSEHTVFFGGAGVSTESGLKDYRSENGIYHTLYYYLTLPLTWRGVLRRDFQAESFKKLSLSAFSSCLNFSANKKFFCSKFTLDFYWQVSLFYFINIISIFKAVNYMTNVIDFFVFLKFNFL